MTRQISIVNMSNWDNEDYLVEEIPCDATKARSILLKPGEHYNIMSAPYKGDGSIQLLITAVEREQPEPFYKEIKEGRRQIVPQMKVEIN